MQTEPVRPPWHSLTAECVTSGAPRRLLGDAFPFLRDVQANYRDTVGAIRVPGGPANPGTIGTAFDVWVQLQATSRPGLEIAAPGRGLPATPSSRHMSSCWTGSGRPKATTVRRHAG